MKIYLKKMMKKFLIYNDFNIVGDNFYFDTDGNVKIDDKIENYTIKAEEITYKKLDEFISKGKQVLSWKISTKFNLVMLF